jgi:hypothetical protein
MKEEKLTHVSFTQRFFALALDVCKFSLMSLCFWLLTRSIHQMFSVAVSRVICAVIVFACGVIWSRATVYSAVRFGLVREKTMTWLVGC